MEWTRGGRAGDARLARRAPRRLVVDDASLVHGSLRDPTWEYVTSAAIARASLDLDDDAGRAARPHARPDGVGSGRAAAYAAPPRGRTPGSSYDGRLSLLNPGSVGQPRDGDPRSSYLVLDTDARVASWHRVAYDIEAVVAAMRGVELPIRLAERLRHGL